MQIKCDVRALCANPYLFLFFFGGPVCDFSGSKPVPENEIIVSEARLREFYQYKSQSFGLPAIANKLEVMSTEERNALKEDFIRAEVLAGGRRMGLGERFHHSPALNSETRIFG